MEGEGCDCGDDVDDERLSLSRRRGVVDDRRVMVYRGPANGEELSVLCLESSIEACSDTQRACMNSAMGEVI
jgi:hypothetical protein